MRVETEGRLEAFLASTGLHVDELAFAEVRLGRMDFSETLKKLGESLR